MNNYEGQILFYYFISYFIFYIDRPFLFHSRTLTPKEEIALGKNYYYGRNGIKQNYVTAAYWIKKAANKGDVRAEFDLGVLYAEGHGVSQSYTKAAYWFRKAANKGDANAENYFGTLYINGQVMVCAG
jgi:TPR repeat protein